MNIKLFYLLPFLLLYYCNSKQPKSQSDLKQIFNAPAEEAKPGVFWYWMHASISKEGITADLEAMKEAGIGLAYIFNIKDVTNPPLYEPVAEQLSPEWWKMIKHAVSEAKRLDIKIAMNACDGFELAGGPWITPELSMQRITWTKTYVTGGNVYEEILPQPEMKENYYRDIAVYAFPTIDNSSTNSIVPKITTSNNQNVPYLCIKDNGKKLFRSIEPCWIQYKFEQPYTCRSIIVQTKGNNYQAHRLVIKVSDNGTDFREVKKMQPPRHGWEDTDADYTSSVEPVTARYFRFYWDKEGSEPASEDLDAAKWKPTLKIAALVLSGEPVINNYEGKSAAVWRISPRTTDKQLTDSLCIPVDKIINITDKMDSTGRISWNAPEGNWTILRIGHTSNGHTNYTGGKGLGLECDKFNPEAAKLQFDKWYGEIVRQMGSDLVPEVLNVFHIDSWECASQNWSPVFRDEFKKRRGYDIMPYLPVMAGIPVGSADVSERILYDIRQTVAELVNDNFFSTMIKLAHKKGCMCSAECIAPTMTSDGMLHHSLTDLPMGEFWLRSPTHDKPNDILDAVSGAHIYGKNIVQSECFTEIRLIWDEHPGMLKTLGDRNFALGINRFIYHVFTHNPWMDREPGMTLDKVGLYFQRDQTWWKQGYAYMDYIRRCQSLLQQGDYVADIAVFTGEEIPSRAILPERLISTLPGIIGEKQIEYETRRMKNENVPESESPVKVWHTANITDPAKWINPLRGYAYDSFNKDALLRLAKVNNGEVQFSEHNSYKLIVVPGPRKMSPTGGIMSKEVAQKLLKMVKQGATILLIDKPVKTPGYTNSTKKDSQLKQAANELWKGYNPARMGNFSEPYVATVGKGRIIYGTYNFDTFDNIGIERDFIATDEAGKEAFNIAFAHRTAPGFDVYFVSNQEEKQRTLTLSLRVTGKLPEIFDPVTGETMKANQWKTENNRTELPVRLDANGSLFVVLQNNTSLESDNNGLNWFEPKSVKTIEGKWKVKFSNEMENPDSVVIFDELIDWTTHPNDAIRYYSGTAAYATGFQWEQTENESRVWLSTGKVANIAEVIVNGTNCGVAWTYPYRVDITKALKPGNNELIINVTNTYGNRFAGDQNLPENERVIKTTAPFLMEGKPLFEAGLLGPIEIVK